MKIIKLGLISVVVLFLISTAITSLLPSTNVVSRAINVEGSIDSAQLFLGDLNNWPLWLYKADSIEVQVDLDKQQVKYGKTIISIISKSPGVIKTEWKTGDGEPMAGELNIIGSNASRIFTIQFAFTQKVSWYPWEKLASILSDKALSPFMEKSLDNLKQKLQENRL